MVRAWWLAGVLVLTTACGGAGLQDAGDLVDAGAVTDAGSSDDAGVADAGSDAGGTLNAGLDAGVDAGSNLDAGSACTGFRFCDDFERWDSGTAPRFPWNVLRSRATLVVDDTRHFSGSKAIHIVTEAFDGGSAFRRALIQTADAGVFPLPGNDMWGRMMMYVANAPAGSVHWTHIQGEGWVVDAGIADGGTRTFRAFTRYGGQQQKRLMANYETSGVQSDCYQHSQTVMPEGRWACFEWNFSGPTGQMRLFLDGAVVAPITINGSGQGCVHPELGNRWYIPRFDGVSLGWEHYQASVSHELWVDDVIIDSTRIGCP